MMGCEWVEKIWGGPHFVGVFIILNRLIYVCDYSKSGLVCAR
jgi:hypothetical protein